MKNSHPFPQVKIFLAISLSLFMISCSDDDNGGTPPPPDVTVVEDFGTVNLSAQYENPAITDREETGTATLKLNSDNTLEYTIQVNNLLGSDQLTIAHIHEGNAAENGPVVVTLVDNDQITFTGNTVTNTVTLTEDEIGAIETGDFYVNVHSVDYPAGLLRGQLRGNVDFAFDVNLSPQNEIPMISDRTESGVAIFRLLENNTLYYTLTVEDVSASDNLTIAHIHDGNAATNGPVIISLVDNDAIIFEENTVNNSIEISEEEEGRLKAAAEGGDALYVNIHSEEYPAGLLRGQIEGEVVLRSDVAMSTANEVPPIPERQETGTAILRLLDNNVLFYHLTVNDIDPADQLTVAHIHEGAEGVNGPILLGLVDNDQITFTDGEASGQVELDEALLTTLQSDDLYVNVHSTQHGAGLLRGQINISGN